MKIDPSTMTLDEIRDWLAERKGWERRSTHYDGTPLVGTQERWFKYDCIYVGGEDDHPIPRTLDAAAAAMPETWKSWSVSSHMDVMNEYTAQAFRDGSSDERYATADTEILARFRLAALCILAEESAHAK